jgi:hypothetical protein
MRLDDAGFFFRYFDGDEYFAAFMGITLNAVGSDGISLQFLKLLLPFIIDHVLHVINHAITCSVFPTLWKSVIVWSVAKVASPSCPSDFRSITIVSVLSERFVRLINGQVLAHVDRSGLLSEFQSGFRCGHSTTTALVRIIEDLRSSMTEERVTMLVLRNFLKSFDWTNIYFCTSLFCRLIFIDRQAIWCSHF